MGFKAEFKFNILEKVVTKSGENGVVEWVSVGKQGVNKYYVKTEKSSSWISEDRLETLDK